MSTATTQKTIRFRIKRQDDQKSPPYWESFDLTYRPNLNIISCLQMICANPVTTEGKQSTPIAWEASCLEEVCGACTMQINGRVRQSCSALVDHMLEETGTYEITLEPMSKFPVIRDLWVDRERMFEALRRTKSWVPIDGTHSQGPGPQESPQQQDVRYALSRCMTCGCCLEACPQYTLETDPEKWPKSFIGAHAFSQVRYFNEHGTGKTLKGERLDVLEGPGGLTDCGNAQNCVKVCPKDIPLTESIAAVGRQATVHAVKKFFTGK